MHERLESLSYQEYISHPKKLKPPQVVLRIESGKVYWKVGIIFKGHVKKISESRHFLSLTITIHHQHCLQTVKYKDEVTEIIRKDVTISLLHLEKTQSCGGVGLQTGRRVMTPVCCFGNPSSFISVNFPRLTETLFYDGQAKEKLREQTLSSTRDLVSPFLPFSSREKDMDYHVLSH